MGHLILDLGLLPHNNERELAINLDGAAFYQINNWYKTDASELFFGDMSIENPAALPLCPEEPWGQKLKKFITFYHTPVEFDNFKPESLTYFHVESSALGLESLANCTLEYFGGDDQALESIYIPFRNNPETCFTAERVQLVGSASILSSAPVLAWLKPKTIDDNGSDFYRLKELSAKSEDIKKFVADTFPKEPCSLYAVNAWPDEDEGNWEKDCAALISAIKDAGHQIYPEESDSYLD